MKDFLTLDSNSRDAFLTEKASHFDAPHLYYSDKVKFIWGERAHSSFIKVASVESGIVVIHDLEKVVEYINAEIYKALESNKV